MSSDTELRDPVEKIAEEFSQRLRRGESPTPAEYAERYPELASRIHRLFPAIALMERCSGPTSVETTGSPDARPGDIGLPFDLGEFHVLREIGRGGMGVVYEAVQTSLGRHVALKVLPPRSTSDPGHRQRFDRESRLAARLQHPHVVAVIASGHHHDTPYYAMQLIDGPALNRVIASGRRCGDLDLGSPESVSRIGRDLSRALACAHAQGILHRDIKPSNVLIDESGNAWLADFGLAWSAGNDDLTASGDIVGTVRYLAPERFQGRFDARGDIYSLGLTLYELLVGVPAFEQSDRAVLLSRILKGDIKPPRERNPRIPSDLERILLRATATSPDDRYQSAAAMAEDFEHCLKSEPLAAGSRPTSERPARTARRAAIALAAVLAAGAILSLVMHNSEPDRNFVDGVPGDALIPASAAAPTASFGLAQRPASSSDGRSRQVETTAPHAEMNAVAFDANDSLVACGGDDRLVRVYEVASGRLRAVLAGHADRVTALSWTRDGKRIASSDRTGVLKFWDAESWIENGAPTLLVRPSSTFDWNPRGDELACVDSEGTHIVILSTEGKERRRLTGHTGHVAAVVWNRDGTRLGSCGKDRTARCWDAATGELLTTIEVPAALYGIAFHPTEPRLALAGADRLIRLRDLPDGRETAVLSGHEGAIHDVAWTPDGKRLVSAGQDGTVRVWDPESGSSVVASRHDYLPIYDVAVGRRGNWIASVGEDAALRLWSLDEGAARLVLGAGRFRTVAYSPDGTRLALASADEQVVHVLSGEGQRQSTISGFASSVTSIAWRPDSRIVATGGWERMLRFWDAATGEAVGEAGPHSTGITAMAWSPEGRHVAVGCWDGAVRVWSTADPKSSTEFIGHSEQIRSLAWRSDGSQFVSGSLDHRACVWKINEPSRPFLTLPHPAPIHGVSWSYDDHQIATITGWLTDDRVRVWTVDPPSGEPTVLELPPTGTALESLVRSRKNGWIVTGDHRGAVQIWRATDTALPKSFLRLNGRICGLSLDRNEEGLATVTGDGAVRLWNLRTGEPLWTAVHLARGRLAVLDATGQLISGSPDAAVDLVQLDIRPGARTEISPFKRAPVESPIRAAP